MSDLRCIAGHTVDVDLLSETAFVLDVGCRGWDFTRGITEIRPRSFIAAYDPDPTIKSIPGVMFRHAAIVGNGVRQSQYAAFSTGEANYLLQPGFPPPPPDAKRMMVACVSIAEIGANWDLVKLDCEGSEFGILEHWPGPIAKQISVEFHDWLDRRKWNDAYFERLFAGLPDYRVVQHELTEVGPGKALGHWDSLLARRDL